MQDAPEGVVMMPNEHPRFARQDIEEIMLWAFQQGASDITIQTNSQIFLEIHGRMHKVTKHRLNHTEIMEMIVHMYGSEMAKAILAGDQDMDFAYEVKPDRNRRVRFRVNITPITTEGSRGVQLTARTIPSSPVELGLLNVETEILQNMAPRQGMIVVTGATGSGKTTLLASMIRRLCEDPNGHRKILTYESPIEYVYDEVDCPTTSIAQTEIGRDLPTFARGTRNSLRRKPTIILVGEARDAETIGEAVTASMTGHLLYTTVHSNGFSDTIRRMVNVFEEDKNSRAVDIISSLRMIVSQQLLQSTDGKRVALREFVIMNDNIVDQILDAGIDNITASCRKVLREHGQTFLDDAKAKFKEGRIGQRELDIVARADRAAIKDIQITSERLHKVKVLVDSSVSLDLHHAHEDNRPSGDEVPGAAVTAPAFPEAAPIASSDIVVRVPLGAQEEES
jgi:defect-in-organelle-trafficking protein DotB